MNFPVDYEDESTYEDVINTKGMFDTNYVHTVKINA